MSHLIQIKQRIRAIEKTRKITRAMRLIAMSLYSKLEKKRLQLKEYRTAVDKLAALVFKSPESVPRLFMPEDISDPRPLIILCTSTKGLCGGLNSNISRFITKKFLLEAGQKASFIAIGQRSKSIINERNMGIIIHEAPETTIPTIPEMARTITQLICNAQPHFTSVTMYYTHLKSFFAQTPTRKMIIPFDMHAEENTHDESNDKKAHQEYEWEQDQKMVSNRIAEHYLYTNIVDALFNNLISENAARFIAMDQSTNNADNYLESLSLTYNKSRQSSITQEIAELSSNMD